MDTYREVMRKGDGLTRVDRLPPPVLSVYRIQPHLLLLVHIPTITAMDTT
jgi:hypothetical protein